MTSTADYIGLAINAATLLVGMGGFAAVIVNLNRSREQQRTESGPYVRVDIGPTTGIDDIKLPEPYYEDSSQVLDLTSSESALEVSAWLRNYQPSALGFALGVRASFLIVVETEEQPFGVDVEVPYLEYDKCVRLSLARLPYSGNAMVMLVQLSFRDLYDHQHTHTYGGQGTNAMHGRLVWIRSCAINESTPEGRSRGDGVDYNVGGIDWRTLW